MCKYCGTKETHFWETEENGMGWTDGYSIPCCEWQDAIDNGYHPLKIKIMWRYWEARTLSHRIIKSVFRKEHDQEKDNIPF